MNFGDPDGDEIIPDCRQTARDPCPPDEVLRCSPDEEVKRRQDNLARLRADKYAIVRPWRRMNQWADSDGSTWTEPPGPLDSTKPMSASKDDAKIRKDSRKQARDDPTLFAAACEHDNAFMARIAPHNEHLLMFEALDWIVEIEDEPRDERARQIVLCFLRSRLSARKFCASKGILPNSLRHAIDAYCSALVARRSPLD
jgi:hypothetical protein